MEPTAICPCKKTACRRHGNCKSCREHHRSKRSLPYCERKRNGRQKTPEPADAGSIGPRSFFARIVLGFLIAGAGISLLVWLLA